MDRKIAEYLRDGKVGVIPTDTIYGIVGSALNQQTVERIYKLRKRNPEKPFIILISKIEDLEKFNVKLTEKQKELLDKYWPNPLSIILPVVDEKYEYLHRGTNSLAFRMPDKKDLLETLDQTGPLVAPSANFEGEKPSETIAQAKSYFGENVEFYCEAARFPYKDEGEIKSEPSTLIQLNEDGSFVVLRKGLFKV